MMLWMWASLAAHASPTCATPSMLSDFMRPGAFGPPPPAEGEKSETNPYDVPNALASDNFVLRWGDSNTVSESALSGTLEAIELARSVELDDMGYPEPAAFAGWKVNVYVGNSGDGAPDISGALGYFTASLEEPMIVLSPDILRSASYREPTIAHEFFHAVQWGMDTVDYRGIGAWYWEATAVWVEAEVLPDSKDYAELLFGYALMPHERVDFFDYPDQGTIQEYHQYGAFILPRYLTEFEANRDLIRESWLSSTGDPIASLTAELGAQGVDFNDAFTRFAAHNATWDYADGAVYSNVVASAASWYPEEDDRYVVEDSGWGDGEWIRPDETLLPQRYGVNTVQLKSPRTGDLSVEFAGDAFGSHGNPAGFGVTVVLDWDGVPEYVDVPLSDGVGALDLPDVGDAEAVYLVVSAWTDDVVYGETFGYDYRIEVVREDGSGSGNHPQPVASETPETPGGCACGAGAPTTGMLWPVALVLGLCVPRRRSQAPRSREQG